MHFSHLFSLISLVLLFSACESSSQLPLTTVSNVDLKRYSGTWNELARYENFKQTGCVGATANYQPIAEGLSVTNSCYDGSGHLKAQDKGILEAVKGSDNSKFEINIPWSFQDDYWILILAEDYRYSVVGSPDREYLWIYSRKTVLSPTDRETISSTLNSLGFNTDKLYWTGFKAMCNVESQLKLY